MDEHWPTKGIGPRIMVALAAVAAAVLLRLAFLDLLGPRTPFLTFYPAVMLAALLGGAVSGLLATAILSVLAVLWVMPPIEPFLPERTVLLTTGLFVLSSALVSWIAESMPRARGRIATAEAEAARERERARAAAALQHLAAIVEFSTDAIFRLGLDGAVTSWNKGAEQLYGYGPDEIIGRSVALLCPPELAGEIPQVMGRIAQGQLVQNYETIRRRKDGSPVPVSVTLSAIRDESGTPVAASAVVRDITAARQAESARRESERRFREVVEGTDNLVTRVNALGRLVYVNPVAKSVFGLEPEECIGRMAFDFAHPDDRDATMRAFAGWMAEGRTKACFENRQVSRTGEVRILAWTVDLHYGPDGQVTAVDSIAQDVTVRRRAEAALRESEERYRSLFDTAGDAIFMGDEQGRILAANQAACDLLGYSELELLDMRIPDIDAHEGPADFRARIAQLREDKNLLFEVEHRAKDGSSIPVEISCRLIQHGGRPAFLSIARDMRERRRAEAALRESEALNRAIIESSPDCIKLLNRAGELVFMSPGGLRLLGMDSDGDILGRPYEVFWQGSDKDAARDALEAARQGRQGRFEGFCPTASGEPRWWDVTINPLSGGEGVPERFLVISRDITARRRAADALAAERERLAGIIETSRDLVFLKDPQLRYLAANAAHKAILGLDPADMLGKTDEELLPPGMAAACRASDRIALLDGALDQDERHDGRWFRVSKRRVERASGEVLGVAATIADITQEKSAFEALRESEERFRQLVESAPDAIFVQTDGVFAYANPALVRLYGAGSAGQLLGKPVLSRIHQDHHDQVRERIRALNHEQQAVPPVEYRHLRLDGSQIDVEVSAVPIFYGGKNGALVYVRDITARKREQALREDMERIARHDLKSPLNAVINLPVLLMEDPGMTPEQLTRLQMIHDAGLRMLEQIDQSLTLYRIETGSFELAPQAVDLAGLARQVAGELAPVGRSLGVELQVDAGLKPVVACGDTLLCRTMIANLMKNAVEASPRGGTVRASIKACGGRAELCVQNQGAVPEEVRPRFFEKYASAGKRRGAGLGTYSARLSAEAQLGSIAMKSSEAEGTEVTVRLPLWETTQ